MQEPIPRSVLPVVSQITITENAVPPVPAATILTKPVGLKFDGDKLEFSLLPMESIREVLKVLGYGKKKYTQTLPSGQVITGANNWKLVDDRRERYYNAAMRHITNWFGGEVHDPETGRHHLAHAICCLLFLIWDDREQLSA